MSDLSHSLFDFLDHLKIVHRTVYHEAIFTVEEGRHLKARLEGAHTKNLFMQDKDGALILISAHAETQLPLNRLHRLIGTRRLSFASADLLQEVLGVRPGSVTGFALLQDKKMRVRFIYDYALDQYDRLNFHPFTNTATTQIDREDFKRFVEATHHACLCVDFQTMQAIEA